MRPYGRSPFLLIILQISCVWCRSRYGRTVRPRPAVPTVAIPSVNSLEKLLVSSLLRRSGTGGWYGQMRPYGCSLFLLSVLYIFCVWWRGRYGCTVRPCSAVPTVAIPSVISLEKFLVSSLRHRSGAADGTGKCTRTDTRYSYWKFLRICVLCGEVGTGARYGRVPPYRRSLNLQ